MTKDTSTETTVVSARADTVNGQTMFSDLKQLLYNAYHDERLTPSTQLTYRVLIDLANRAKWTYPIAVSREELMKYTRFKAKNTIDEAKRTLKRLGYIDFKGGEKPSKFTVYRPRVWDPNIQAYVNAK